MDSGRYNNAAPQPLELLAKRLRRKCPDVHAHGSYVARLAVALAQELGLTADDTSMLARAAFFHDLGKLAVPHDIRCKPAELDVDEQRIMRTHVAMGRYLIQRAQCDGVDVVRLARIVGEHHERVDGNGYPAGLVRDAIDPLARALSVVDAFAAMVEDRPYQAPMDPDVALAELESSAGTQFDERCVRAFVAVIRRQPQLLVA